MEADADGSWHQDESAAETHTGAITGVLLVCVGWACALCLGSALLARQCGSTAAASTSSSINAASHPAQGSLVSAGTASLPKPAPRLQSLDVVRGLNVMLMNAIFSAPAHAYVAK